MLTRMLVGLSVLGIVAGLPGDHPLPTRSRGLGPTYAIADSGMRRLSETEWRISRSGMIARMTRDFVPIMTIAERELTPLYEEQRLVGYRVGRMQHFAFFSDLGLRDGDIIRLVNGEPLQSLYEMYLRFRAISEADLTIERDGRLVTLRYWIS